MKMSFKQYYNLSQKYLKPLKIQIGVLALLIVFSIGFQILNPQILRFFIDSATGGEPNNVLYRAAVLFIAISLGQQVLSVISTYLCQHLGWTATNALREDLTLHCIRLDMDFHKSKQPGEIIERLDSDVNNLFDFFSKMILEIVGNIILLIGIMVVLLWEDWRISTALILYAIISMAVLTWYQSKGVHLWSEEREKSSKFFGFLGEQLSSTEDIRSSGSENHTMYKFHKFAQELYPSTLMASMVNYKLWNISTFLSAVGMVTALGLGGYLWSKGQATIGTAYLILSYTVLINGPIDRIRRQVTLLQKAEASIYRIQQLFDTKPLILDGKEELPKGCSLPLEIRGLHFRYSEDTPVLQNVSLELKANRILGVLGRTGSGKTTLARLLTRLYDPQEGNVFIGGTDIRTLKLESLRSHVAYVTQEVQLFNASIRENLSFFNPDITDETIIHVLNEIGLKEWIDSFENGLDTILESGGGSLSSGEAQTLALVRIFLKDPGLVILDEASSRLDPITEKLMEKAIDKLLANRSSVIIAHRLSTLERADDILILEHGKVIEYGPRETLAKKTDSRYYQLLQNGIEEVLA